ncbi:MAG: DUF4867 family protein [Clostridiales bacterium]|nr:DUF4867 family protein [Clostridiales bacterium]
MTMLETLREKNPGLPFYSVFDAEFRPFGKVIEDFDAAALIAACEKAAVMPEKGVSYVPDMPALEAVEGAFDAVKLQLRGEGHTQIGVCWGYNSTMQCMEYHRASEHNIAVSDCVLLLAAQQDLEGNDLPAGKVKAFYCPKGTTIEVYATSMHYAPCQVSDDGFRFIVILPRGTNHDLTCEKPDTKEGKILWAVDKWLIAHPDAPEVAQGAYPGIQGENYVVKY